MGLILRFDEAGAICGVERTRHGGGGGGTSAERQSQARALDPSASGVQ